MILVVILEETFLVVEQTVNIAFGLRRMCAFNESEFAVVDHLSESV